MKTKTKYVLFLACVACGVFSDSYATPEDDFRTGSRYYLGRDGVQKNEAEAAAWFRKAAEQGHAQAQLLLGACYVLGRGVECSFPEARKWLEKSAAQGNEDAQEGLRDVEARINECIEKCRQASRYYDEKQYAEAAELWRKAAVVGIPEGQHNLARIHYLGQGVEKSEAEFERWLNKAAAQGFEPSVQLLAAWKKSKQPRTEEQTQLPSPQTPVSHPSDNKQHPLAEFSVAGVAMPEVQAVLKAELSQLSPAIQETISGKVRIFEAKTKDNLKEFQTAQQANDEQRKKAIRENQYLAESDLINSMIYGFSAASQIVEKMNTEAQKYTKPNRAGRKFNLLHACLYENIYFPADVEILHKHGYNFDRVCVFYVAGSTKKGDFTAYNLAVHSEQVNNFIASVNHYLSKLGSADESKAKFNVELNLNNLISCHRRLKKILELQCVSSENIAKIKAVDIDAQLDKADSSYALFQKAEQLDAMQLAIEMENAQMIQAQIAKGYDLQGALLYAVDRRKPIAIKTIITGGAKADVADKDGWTPLMLASLNGHEEVVRSLLSVGANVEAAEKDGWTSLMLASQNDHVEVVRSLLSAGANVDALTKKGVSSLVIAYGNNRTTTANEIIRHILKNTTSNQEGRQALQEGAKMGNAQAQYQLAILLHSEKADEDSFKWMSCASDRGYLPAQLALPEYYNMGWGVKSDRMKGITHARALVNSGYKEAVPVLASCLCGMGMSYWLDGLYRAAYRYFKESAELGDAVGQLFLARMYAQGLYVKKDKRKARTWYEKSAAQGNEEAEKELKNL